MDGIVVPVDRPVQNGAMDPNLKFDGFVTLNSDLNNPIRSIANLLFIKDKLIVLDNETDFHHIHVFDANSGIYLYNIGKITETNDPRNGIKGISDVAYNPTNNEIRILSRGHLSFSDYDLAGNFLRSIPIGAFGDHLAYLSPNEWVVYNELTSTEITGLNYLLFYNNQGDLLKRSMAYNTNQDNIGYQFTGFLRRSGDNIWFSPPFSDTIFLIENQKASPTYSLQLGANALPVNLRASHVNGNDLLDATYLDEGLFANGRFLVFTFQRSRKMLLGIYDAEQNVFFDSENSDKSKPINQLLRAGKVFTKNSHTFALVLTPYQIQRFMTKFDRSEWEKLAPGLFDRAEQKIPDDQWYVLYFSFK